MGVSSRARATNFKKSTRGCASPSGVKHVRIAAALTLALVVASVPRDAHAVIVERVVAVIGDKPILLSELRARAKPQLTVLMAQTGGNPTRMAVAEPQIYRALH